MNIVKEKIRFLFEKSKEHKKEILISFIAFFLFVLLFIESGTALYIHVSSRAKIFLLIGIIITVITLLLLLFNYKETIIKFKNIASLFKENKKNAVKTIFKSVSLDFYIIFSLLIFVLISFLINKSKSTNLNGYLMLGSILFISLFLSKLFSLEQYSKAFYKIMLVICIFSCIVNLFYLISGYDLANSIQSTDSGSSRITSFFFLFIFNITNNADRMSGPFWEPGVFATLSLFAMLLYHFYVNRKQIIPLIVFSVGILFTQSSAGILLLAIVWSIIVLDLINNSKIADVLGIVFIAFFFFVAISIFVPQILNFLANVFPSVFGKFHTISFASRYYSLIYGFKIFFKSGLMGFGTSTARELFFSMTAADNILVDAFTSTLGSLIASYGIAGLFVFLLPVFGIICNKKLSVTLKILIFIFYFLTTLQESHVEIFMISLFYLLFSFDSIKCFFYKTNESGVFYVDGKRTCLLNLFYKKDEKGNVSSNIVINTVIKFLSILIGFVTISIYSGYFGNKNAYGIWLSMISISTWILQLDFGFGNSLRNRLTEARVQKDVKKEQAILSSTYAITLIMTFVWIAVSLILCNVLDLFSIVKASDEYVSSTVLKTSVLIVLVSIAIELSLRNITYVLQVIGRSGLASSLTLISNVTILIFASVFRINGEAKFIVLSIVYSAAILLPLIIASIVVFSKKVVPFVSFKSINKESIKSVSKLGIGFFVVQMSNLFLWSLNDILLINLLNGPDVVVDYTEYYKLFSAVTGLAMILQGPVWVGISAAKENGDIEKFKKYCKINFIFCSFLAICSIVLTFSLPLVFRLWLGESNVPNITIAFQLIMLFFSLVTCGYQYFGLICNGLGSIKTQIIVAFIVTALKIPLTLLLNSLFGNALQWSSVILANSILISIYLFVLPFSIKKEVNLMKKKALKNKGESNEI